MATYVACVGPGPGSLLTLFGCTLQGPRKKYACFAKQEPDRARQKILATSANFFRGLCTCVSTSFLIKLAGGHCGQGAESGGLQSNYGPSFRLTLSRRVCWASRFVRSFPSSTIAERPKIPSPMSFARRSLSLADAAVALSLSVLLSAHPVCHSLEESRQIPDQISRFYCGGYSWGFGIGKKSHATCKPTCKPFTKLLFVALSCRQLA